MTEQSRSGDDMDKRVEQASPGEPEAGVRAESARAETAGTDPAADQGEAADRDAARRDDRADPVRSRGDDQATERIERMQQEGKGMRGASTQGRTDQADEEAIERAASGEDEEQA